MERKRTKITESQLKNIIREMVLNEISQQAKASAFVRANNDLNNLRRMRNDGQTAYRKNGRLFDVDNEIRRRQKQADNFRNELEFDLNSDIDRTNDGDYEMHTPFGHVHSGSFYDSLTPDKNNANTGNMAKLDKLKNITDAMKGLDDELSGSSEKRIRNLERQQRHLKALRDYDDAHKRWEEDASKKRREQKKYDDMSPLNPKKWVSKRPYGPSAEPLRPKLEPNDDGQFDPYFAHSNPEDYDKDIKAETERANRYRTAKDNYFNNGPKKK